MNSQILYAVALGTTLSIALGSTASAQVVPRTQINIGGSNGSGADGIGLAVRGTTFYAAWAEQGGNGAATQDIWFASSTDDGVTWGAPTRVDTGDVPHLNDSDQPRLVVTADGTVVVIFQEFRDAAAAGSTADADVFYNRSTDGGATWLPSALPLNTTTAGANIASDVDRIWLHASGNNVYATWEEDEIAGLGQEEEIKFVMSTNAGATWSAPAVITSTMPQVDDVDDPKVAGSGLNVVVAFIDDNGGNEDLEILNSTDGGVTWTQTAVETNTAGDADTARIAMDGNNVLVAWFDDEVSGSNDNEIHAVFSTDGGVTWSAEMTINPTVGLNGPATTHDFDLIVDGNDFYITYTDDSAAIIAAGGSTINAGKLYMSRSTNAGATWNLEIPIDADPLVVNQRPHMAATQGRVVVHSEIGTNGNNTLAYYVSTDAGLTWGPMQAVPGAGPDVDSEDDNNGTAMAISPVSGTAISCFWDNLSPTGNNEVYISGIDGTAGIGTNYCGPAPLNSAGLSGTMSVLGSASVGDNNVTLRAVEVPANAFGFFITSQTQGFVMNPAGSQGNLCVLGNIGRYVGPGQIQNSGLQGVLALQIDLTMHPTPTGLVAVAPGETWNFQAWHRDFVMGTPTSNFTDGIEITFQ